MRVTVVEWPDGLRAGTDGWSRISSLVRAEDPEVLVTNEMPFGSWLASSAHFDDDDAKRSIDDHAAGLDALIGLGIPAIVSSRPVWDDRLLANEAFEVSNGASVPIHRKSYFPSEPGWEELAWFRKRKGDFTVGTAGSVPTGVLLCTEAMFNEHARDYGVQGAALIAIPRATGLAIGPWLTAGAMAALVSGSYVASSNRVGRRRPGGPRFGGGGFAYAPDGTLLGMTGPERPCITFDLDIGTAAERQRNDYPCYVARAAALDV